MGHTFNSHINKPAKKRKTLHPVRVIVLSFLAIILLGTFLLLLPVSSRSGKTAFIDAFFASTSASCITGLFSIPDLSHWSNFGKAVIIILVQLGSLGIVTITTSISFFFRRKIGMNSMRIIGESSGTGFADFKSILKLTTFFTFLCEFIGAFLLMIRFVPLLGTKGVLFSLIMSIMSYTNSGIDMLSGFLPHGQGLEFFAGDFFVCAVIALLIIVGGLGFIVVQDIFEAKFKPIFQKKDTAVLNLHSKICLMVSAILILSGAILFFIFEFNNTLGGFSILEKINISFFQSISSRTAGFSLVDIESVHEISKVIAILLMFIGGCPGSAAGGIKVTTMAVLAITVIRSMQGMTNITYSHHRFTSRVIYKALTITTLGIILIFINAALISTLNPHIMFLDALFEGTSAFSTTGFSLNLPSQLDLFSKFFLCFTMFVGRVGPLSMGFSILLKQKTAGESILPEAKMIIG